MPNHDSGGGGGRLDRMLSEDPTTVVWLEGSDPYHAVARTEPLVTGCGLSPDPDRGDLNRAGETEAIQNGRRRCGRCAFAEPLAVYVEGHKEFHRLVETPGRGPGSACNAVSSLAARRDAVRRNRGTLLHNGVEPCGDCWAPGAEPADTAGRADDGDDDVVTDGGEDDLGEWLPSGEADAVVTPSRPHELVLNPGREAAPRNPLCPVCGEQIRPVSNAAERRFVCGCERVWRFEFDREPGCDGRSAFEDPYAGRVERFHDRLRDEGDEDYLTALAGAFDPGDLPATPDTPVGVESALAEVTAERNRLFWAAFLAEEAGEVASCLTSGEPPEDFEEEVADVLILCFAIADCFGFDMLEAFDEKMSENEAKPKNQDGTGKLPSDARDQWGGG